MASSKTGPSMALDLYVYTIYIINDNGVCSIGWDK